MTMLYIKYTSFVSCCCREDFFIYFHYKSMVYNDMPGAWPVWTPGAPLAAFIKENIIYWSTQHMKALGHMVSEKKIFLCFSHDAPGAGPVWTPGAWLAEFIAGFIKRTTIHGYTQNMKALGFVVSEKKIFRVFPLTPPGRGPYGPQGTVGRIYKEDHYTLIHTKSESSGSCGFREEDFFMFFHDAPGAGPVWTPGA